MEPRVRSMQCDLTAANAYFAHISLPPFSSSFLMRRRCARTAADSLLVDDFTALTASAECSGLDTFRFTFRNKLQMEQIAVNKTAASWENLSIRHYTMYLFLFLFRFLFELLWIVVVGLFASHTRRAPSFVHIGLKWWWRFTAATTNAIRPTSIEERVATFTRFGRNGDARLALRAILHNRTISHHSKYFDWVAHTRTPDAICFCTFFFFLLLPSIYSVYHQ